MKARIVPNRQMREMAMRAIEIERVEVCKVFVKVAALVLWDQFGFGAKRNERFIRTVFGYVDEYCKEYGADYEFKLDQELERAKIKINFEGR